MLDKIKANFNYALCAFLGLFNFIMMAFNYLSAFMSYDGEREVMDGISGYGLLKLLGEDASTGGNAAALAIIGAILQLILLIGAIALLAYGVLGLLKGFGIFDKLPNKIGCFDSKKLALLGLLGYAAIAFLVFLCFTIYGLANTEELGSFKIGICVGFGGYFSFIFSALVAAAPIVLPKYVSGLNEGSSNGPQVVYVCTKCGKKAAKGVRFCTECGGNVAANVIKQYDYICSGCGRKMKKTDRFCTECGGNVQAVEIKQFEYICGGCGRKMKKTDRFCNECGGSVVRREIGAAPTNSAQ